MKKLVLGISPLLFCLNWGLALIWLHLWSDWRRSSWQKSCRLRFIYKLTFWLNRRFLLTHSQGAGKEIREAISDPTPEIQERAWNVVLPLVEKLRACYEHSLELERIVPKLLGQLVGGRLNPTQHLETQQALVKQLAEILEFVLKFDEYKVSCVGD